MPIYANDSATIGSYDVTELVYENFDNYLQEEDNMQHPDYAMQMLTSESKFSSFIGKLTEGMSPQQVSSVTSVCNRQREYLLEESRTQFGSTPEVVGYAVSYFPILTDIYADPVIAQAVTTYPIDKSIISLPRIKHTATVKNTDGTVTQYPMPRAQYLIRAKSETIAAAPGDNVNLFTHSNGFSRGEVTPDKTRINKRYFMMKEVVILGSYNAGDDTSTLVNLNMRPDARGQLSTTFTFHDANGTLGTGKVIGNIDFDKGELLYNIAYTSDNAECTFTTEKTNLNVVYSPKTGDVGRVKIKIQIDGWDVDVDTKEEFEIELESETIQNYQDIYNID